MSRAGVGPDAPPYGRASGSTEPSAPPGQIAGGRTTAVAARHARFILALTAAALALASLAVHLGLAGQLSRSGVLSEANVLFDADPAIYTTSFTQDKDVWRWGGRSFAHPNISNVIYPVVRATAAILHTERPYGDAVALQRQVALYISPIAAAAASSILFLTFMTLGLGLVSSLVLAILSQATFSGVLFGSIPESYALSGCALALLFLTAARSAQSGGRVRWITWIVVGSVVTGITITNAAVVGLVMFAVAYGTTRSLRTAVVRAIVLGTAVLAITAATYKIGAAVVGDAPAFNPRQTSQIAERRWPTVHRVVQEFPAAVANTFAPPRPIAMPYSEVAQAHHYILTYRAEAGSIPDQWIRSVAALLVLMLGVAGARWASPQHRILLAAAALVIGFNWVLHSCLGNELFLYSQHWQAALLIAMSAALAYRGAAGRVARAGLVTLLALCVVNSVVVWTTIMHTVAPRL